MENARFPSMEEPSAPNSANSTEQPKLTARQSRLTPAHASEQSQFTQSKLLEGEQHGGTRLDTGATGTAAAGNPALEAVGAINRATQRGRKGDGKP